ncbi:unnamed protein product [Linum tenue]|uniref:Ankyrin repeat domain-containing protein EMB506, chloroplastic n=1 Tax=Linum tenue TaxID=586396 RepID=A0AAV0NAH7_9ROSI|nr:unnamed protein product [Linum tenue]
MVLTVAETASTSLLLGFHGAICPRIPSFSQGINLHQLSRNGRFVFRQEQKWRASTMRTRVVESNEALALETYGGVWEDPDDGSESDYDDGEDENGAVGGTETDDESESRGGGSDAQMPNTTASETYEEDLAKEVEQLLTPEERRILQENETPNLGKISTAKWKPLQTLALSGQIRHMDKLVKHGLDIDSIDKGGRTALHKAVIGKKEAVISHLLRRGAIPHIRDKDGASPLHYAAEVGAIQSVKLLIKYKVDVNATDEEGWTPLHIAVQGRNRDIAKVLLVNGADKTRRNKNGMTALDIALRYGRDFKSYDLAKLLMILPANRDPL